MMDVLRFVGAVARNVSRREHEGRPAWVVAATCTYDTGVDDVWDAISSEERIPRWFLPISGDLRLGGRYQLQGNAGGQITGCEPPRRLELTWEYGGQVSWVHVRLSGLSDGGTRLELEHIAHVPDEMWNQYGPGAAGVGWDLALMGLGMHLSTSASVDRKQAEAWPASEQGRSFISQSSDAWGRASIGAGTAELAAKDAARRTRAFYTGEVS